MKKSYELVLVLLAMALVGAGIITYRNHNPDWWGWALGGGLVFVVIHCKNATSKITSPLASIASIITGVTGVIVAMAALSSNYNSPGWWAIGGVCMAILGAASAEDDKAGT